MKIFSTFDCSGSPTSTMHYPTGACNLGGTVYTCSNSETCLQTRLYAGSHNETLLPPKSARNHIELAKAASLSWSNGTCSGTKVFDLHYVCDQCTGGSTGPSFTWRGCNSNTPYLDYCGDGACSVGCNTIKLPAGCNSYNATSPALDITSGSCSTMTMTTYQDYNSCSGTVLDQSVFIANQCNDMMIWEC